MADGQLFKPEKDFTKEVDKLIPEAEELAKVFPSLKSTFPAAVLTVIPVECTICH